MTRECFVMKIKTVYKTLTILSTTVIFIFLIYCLFVAVIPLDVITYKNVFQPVINKDHKVKPGELLYIDVDLCKNFNFPRESYTTTIENNVKVELVQDVPPTDVGCKLSHYQTKVTKEFPQNEFIRLHRTIFYRVSPFTLVKEEWISEWFEVIP